HELPTLLLLAHARYVFEIEAVGHDHAHRRHLQRVDRVEDAVDRAWHGLPVAVRQEGRDLAFMHPGNRVHVQAGLSLPLVAVVPRPLLQAAPVVAGAKTEDGTLGTPRSLR